MLRLHEMTYGSWNSVQNKIRRILRQHDGGNSLNSAIVRELFEALIIPPENPFQFYIYKTIIQEGLLACNCEDHNVISAIEFLEFLIDIGEDFIAQEFRSWVTNKEDIRVSVDQREIRNLFADFRLISETSLVKIFERVLLDGNFDFLTVLIKSGKCLEFPSDFEIMTNAATVLATLRDHRTDHHDPAFQRAVKFNISQGTLYRHDIKRAIITQKYRETPNGDFKRKSIVRLCINIFIKRLQNVSYKDRYSKCLRLAFEATGEPMVSSHEVERYLRDLRFYVPCDDFVDRVTALYVEFMLESHPSPRTLQHLCRCQVRKCLEKAGHRPEETTLPKRLVEYLKLYL